MIWLIVLTCVLIIILAAVGDYLSIPTARCLECHRKVYYLEDDWWHKECQDHRPKVQGWENY